MYEFEAVEAAYEDGKKSGYQECDGRGYKEQPSKDGKTKEQYAYACGYADGWNNYMEGLSQTSSLAQFVSVKADCVA